MTSDLDSIFSKENNRSHVMGHVLVRGKTILLGLTKLKR